MHVAREPVVLGIGGESEGLPELPVHQLAPGSQLAHPQPRNYQSIIPKSLEFIDRSISQTEEEKNRNKANCADCKLEFGFACRYVTD